MFADTLSLSPDVPTAVATNTVAHVCRYRDAGLSEYGVEGTTPPTEKVVQVAHTVDKNAVQRSAIKVVQTLADSNGVAAFGGWTISCNRPNNAAFTDAVMIAQLNYLLNLLAASSNANATKLLSKQL